ncbi:hypothetical protein CXB51_009798 [Gossypium anomalum]|uniref:Aminotransferase-like plant mobile domain-containing protein n=1 Tax=Gossypium anomalum TaxID=47600 RepID=A0A8J6D5U4_9ROSI|nr:hypothetical protein CXB51_009798 [Gossypium anomalum]
MKKLSEGKEKKDGYRVLRLRCHFPKYDPDERIMPYLRLAKFGDVALIQRFDLRPNLLSALVEWWCTETHTFIMPCGECTITLEDVAMQLGLRVDGAVVTGRSKVLEPSVVCHRLLGRSLQGDVCCSSLYYTADWGVLLLNNTSNRVHLKYLPLLEDFSRAGSYNWGSAVLAALYYELCRATKHGVSNMAGCLGLLQYWALYRMPFLTAIGDVSRNWCEPDINHLPSNDRGFLWMPYSAVNIVTLIPQRVHAEARIWCINTPVLNFSTVEWYNSDRVMRQFGCKQFVPVEPQQFADVHGKTMQGRHTFDWSVEHQCYVALWNTRYDRRPEMHSCMFDFSPSTEYMQWYMNRWRVYLYGGQLMIVPGHGYRRGNQPTVEVEDQHMADPDSGDQVLNTSEQWVDTFCNESQSSSYNPDIGGSSSYHPDMGGSS